MSNVRRFESLMNQDSIAERNFDLTQRISRIVSFNALAGHDVVLFDPGAVGRNPLRIENNLGRVTQAVGQRKLILSNSNLVSLHLFPVLPKRQLECGNAYGDANVRLSRLKRCLLDSATSDSV